MSAAIMPVLKPQPARMPPRAARPWLRLVGPGDRVGREQLMGPERWRGPEQWRGPESWAETGELVGPYEGDWVPPVRALRLTRGGRLFMTLMVIVATAALAVVLATSVDAALRTDAPQVKHVTTVSAGQTLSEVAATQLPGLPIHDAVAQIQLVNGLNSLQVHAGQSLLIPELP